MLRGCWLQPCWQVWEWPGTWCSKCKRNISALQQERNVLHESWDDCKATESEFTTCHMQDRIKTNKLRLVLLHEAWSVWSHKAHQAWLYYKVLVSSLHGQSLSGEAFQWNELPWALPFKQVIGWLLQKWNGCNGVCCPTLKPASTSNSSCKTGFGFWRGRGIQSKNSVACYSSGHSSCSEIK